MDRHRYNILSVIPILIDQPFFIHNSFVTKGHSNILMQRCIIIK